MIKIKLNINGNKCLAMLGNNIINRLPEMVYRTVKNNKIYIIYDSNFYALHGRSISGLFRRKSIIELVIQSGEKSKSVSELNKIYDFLLANKISRSNLILAVGGGVISDLVGYTSATILRGVPFAIVSTTLLGMIDASVGGKTGINHRTGKNLIGTFYQPKFIIDDLTLLSTLPEREFISGFGEILKYGGLIGEEFIQFLDKYHIKENQFNNKYLLIIIKKSIEYKKVIIEADEKEHSKRMILNFGHTIGHAIEKSLGYKKLLHGEALILGLISAVNISINSKAKRNEKMEKYFNLLKDYVKFLPYVNLNKDKILSALDVDKKRRNSRLNFILLDRLGKPIIRNDINNETIEKSINYMNDCYKKLGMRNA